MAAKKEAAPAPAPEKEAPAKKGLPIKMIGIVGVAMIVQTVIVVVVMTMFGPAKSKANVEHAEIKPDAGQTPEEVLVVEDKFQNHQSGVGWIWDASIYVQIKARNSESVENTLKQRNAEIKQELSQIIARAQLAQLKEPDRQTVTRQVSESLNRIFGNDEKNEPLVEKVLIPKLRGFKADM